LEGEKDRLNGATEHRKTKIKTAINIISETVKRPALRFQLHPGVKKH
jgi:hypothetical protein